MNARDLDRVSLSRSGHWLGRPSTEREPDMTGAHDELRRQREFAEGLDALSRAALTPWPPEKDAA